MNTQSWLLKASRTLECASVSTHKLDCTVLLSDALGVDKSWIHAHPEHELTQSQLKILDSQIERRKNHEPLAYIRGKQEFYGREFLVSPDTLTPRPETETMVAMMLKQIEYGRLKAEDKPLGRHHSLQPTAHSSQPTDSSQPSAQSPTPRSPQEPVQIIDIGTGSGCIIITAALELSSVSNLQSPISCIGLDISEPALKIAQKNADNLDAPVNFNHFDLRKDPLTSILNPQSSICILANLPYVPEDFHINLAASHEPPFAIFGGKDGLDYYRLLFAQLSGKSPHPAALPSSKIQAPRSITVFTESLPPQHQELAAIAKTHGFKLQKSQDFIQLFALKRD